MAKYFVALIKKLRVASVSIPLIAAKVAAEKQKRIQLFGFQAHPRKSSTTTQQGAAPDRLQLRSLRSCLASVSALPAAGELGR